MKETLNILRKNKISTERKYKQEFDRLNQKIRELEFEVQESNGKWKEKEKVSF